MRRQNRNGDFLRFFVCPMREKVRLASLCALIIGVVLFLFWKIFRPPIFRTTAPAIIVRCDDNNILSVEIHNRSSETIYLPYFRFSADKAGVEKILSCCDFQINSNLKTTNLAPLSIPVNIRERDWTPIYGLDKLQIIINTQPTTEMEGELQLPEFVRGSYLIPIEPERSCVLTVDLSDYIGDARSRGDIAFCYTLGMSYVTQRELDNPTPKEPLEIDDRKPSNPWILFLHHIGLKRTHENMFFGDNLQGVKIIDILRIEGKQR